MCAILTKFQHSLTFGHFDSCTSSTYQNDHAGKLHSVLELESAFFETETIARLKMIDKCPMDLHDQILNPHYSCGHTGLTRSEKAMEFKTFDPCHRKRPRDIQKSGQCFYVTIMILMTFMTSKVFMNVMVPFLRLSWRHHDILHSQVVYVARCCDVVV